MPIYEYKCEGCSAVFEVFQKMSDPPPASHDCGSMKVTRLLSNTSFVLKGTGWYATDYANKAPGPAAGDKNEGSGAGKQAADRPDNKADSASKDSSASPQKEASGAAPAGTDKGQKPSAPPPGKGGGGAAAA